MEEKEDMIRKIQNWKSYWLEEDGRFVWGEGPVIGYNRDGQSVATVGYGKEVRLFGFTEIKGLGRLYESTISMPLEVFTDTDSKIRTELKLRLLTAAELAHANTSSFKVLSTGSHQRSSVLNKAIMYSDENKLIISKGNLPIHYNKYINRECVTQSKGGPSMTMEHRIPYGPNTFDEFMDFTKNVQEYEDKLFVMDCNGKSNFSNNWSKLMSIPTNRLGQEELTSFLFDDVARGFSADDYGRAICTQGIKDLTVGIGAIMDHSPLKSRMRGGAAVHDEKHWNTYVLNLKMSNSEISVLNAIIPGEMSYQKPDDCRPILLLEEQYLK